MGLKDWLAKLSGPKGYGWAMGRTAREGGSALANALFMSHGTTTNTGPTIIFDTESDMKAAGFTPRFEAMTPLDLSSLSAEEHVLFMSVQIAMISFAFIANSNAALGSMRRKNTSRFRNGLGPSLLQSMIDCGLFERIETARVAVTSYVETVDTASTPMVLNTERAASGDLLERFILRAVQLSKAKSTYGFTRDRFDVFAIPLVEETFKSIFAATQEYNW